MNFNTFRTSSLPQSLWQGEFRSRIRADSRQSQENSHAVILLRQLSAGHAGVIHHWQMVNASLATSSGPPILLKGGYAVENLIADRSAILQTINEQPGLDNERSIASATRDQAKEALLARFYQLRATMIAALYGSPELMTSRLFKFSNLNIIKYGQHFSFSKSTVLRKRNNSISNINEK
jgi:hypothetical protein